MATTSLASLPLVVPLLFLAATSLASAQESGLRVHPEDWSVLIEDGRDAQDLAMSAGPSGYTVVWSQTLDDACCSRRVYALALDALGRSDSRFGSTAPLRLDPDMPFHERILPDVATGPDGTSYVVWYDLYDFSSHLVTVSPSGAAMAPRRIHAPHENWQTEPTVATGLDGSVWVAWATSDVGDDGVPWPPDAFARRFDPAGKPLGPQFRINAREPANGVSDPLDIAIGTGGRMTAVFRSDADLGFFVRRFDSDGRPLGEEERLFGAQSLQYREGPKVCAQPGGEAIVLAIDETDGLWSRHIDAQGVVGEPIQISPEVNVAFAQLQLACSPFGGAITAWRDFGQEWPFTSESGGRVVLVELDASGRPVGEPSTVSNRTENRFLAGIAIALGAGGRGLLVTHETRGGAAQISEPSFSLHSYPLSVTRSRLPTRHDLRFEDDRFTARVLWRADWGAGSGLATGRSLTDDSGAFWFFRPDNLELTSKLLDGRTVNDAWWFFYSGLTTVEHWIELTDRTTGRSRGYHNLPGRQRSLADTRAFTDTDPSDSSGDAAPSADRTASGCGGTVLCLGDGFEIEVDWLAPTRPSGDRSGLAQAAPVSTDTGAFWFFRPDNLELLVKVLDGRSINGHFWVFWASLSSLEFTIRVSQGEDPIREYHHPPGPLAGGFDLEAFAASGR